MNGKICEAQTLNPTVVILLSDKRSGSTMMQEALCAHPDVRHVAYSPHTYFETHHWLKAAVLLNRPPEKFANGVVYPGYGSKANARAYMIDCIKGNVPNFEPSKEDRELVFQGWEAMARTFAEPVFFEKSPQILAHRAALEILEEWIANTSSEVKLIALVRNPMAVMYSAKTLFGTEPQTRQFAWARTHRNLLDFCGRFDESKLKLIKYEDVVAQPEQEFGNLCRFVGVSPVEGISATAHTSSLLKWRDDPTFTLQLDPEVATVAGSLGYTAEELANPWQPHNERQSIHTNQITDQMRRIYNRAWDRAIKPLILRAKHRRSQ